MLSGAVLLSLGLTACGVKNSGGTIQSLSLEAYEPTQTAAGDTADTSDETSANDSTSTEDNAPADITKSGTDTASAKVHYTLMIPMTLPAWWRKAWNASMRPRTAPTST